MLTTLKLNLQDPAMPTLPDREAISNQVYDPLWYEVRAQVNIQGIWRVFTPVKAQVEWELQNTIRRST